MWLKPLALFLPLLLTNCTSMYCCMAVPLQQGQDSVHYLVVGVGILTVAKPETSTGVHAARLQALGVSVSDQPGLKLAIGYTSSMTVAVPDGAEDVRVEISQRPGGPLIIDTQRAVLADDNR
jgi:hypothetical protein